MPKRRDHGDGALYHLKSRGLWRGVVDLGYDADGKRIQKYVHGRTQRIAKERLDELKAEIAEHGAPLGKSTTVSDVATDWLENVARPDVDPKTYSGYAGVVRNWIAPTIGRKRVATLKPSDVRTVRQAIASAGRATSTARQAHVVLSMILDHAVAERLMRRNVAADVRKPSAKTAVVKVRRSELDADDVIAILKTAAAMPNAEGDRWWFKMLTGRRQGEILGATLDDLDLGEPGGMGAYTVNWKLEELRREHGCGDEPCGYKQAARCPEARWIEPDEFDKVHLTGPWHLTAPKSTVRRGEVIPLIPQLAEAMRRRQEATKAWPNPHGLIWRTEDGSPIKPRDDAEQWRALLVAAGVVRDGVTGHWTRHTLISAMARLGIDARVIGDLVGHSPEVDRAIYTHVSAVDRERAVEALGALWAEGLAIEG